MDQAADIAPFREQYTYYSKRLLSDMGLGDLKQPERTRLLASIEGYVQQVMVNCLLENLTEPSADEAEEVLNRGGSPEEVLTTLVSTLPNAEVVIADRLIKTYAEMLNDCRQLTSAIAGLKGSAQTSPPPASN